MKNILIGVSSSAAIYKALALISLLKKENFNIKTVMTKNSMELITPRLFEALTGNPVYTELFAERIEETDFHTIENKTFTDMDHVDMDILK